MHAKRRPDRVLSRCLSLVKAAGIPELGVNLGGELADQLRAGLVLAVLGRLKAPAACAPR